MKKGRAEGNFANELINLRNVIKTGLMVCPIWFAGTPPCPFLWPGSAGQRATIKLPPLEALSTGVLSGTSGGEQQPSFEKGVTKLSPRSWNKPHPVVWVMTSHRLGGGGMAIRTAGGTFFL